MINGKTDSGFDFTIADTVGDDMEFLELSVQADRGDFTVMPDLVLHLLGAEQKKALYEHCRTDGIVSTKKVAAEVRDIFGAIREAGESAAKN